MRSLSNLLRLLVLAALLGPGALRSTAQAADATDSLDESREFVTATVHPGLPAYRFNLATPDVLMIGNDMVSLGVIEITVDSSGEMVQRISPAERISPEWLRRSFALADYNFDGYLDISVVREHGAKWASYGFWLFDSASGQFLQPSLAKALGRLSFNEIFLDPETKTFTVTRLGSAWDNDQRTYAVEGDRLTLIRSVEREVEGKRCLVKIRERVKGKMKTVSERWEPIPEE